eukprot:1394498-Prorocentrum_lima.AAC.1
MVPYRLLQGGAGHQEGVSWTQVRLTKPGDGEDLQCMVDGADSIEPQHLLEAVSYTHLTLPTICSV